MSKLTEHALILDLVTFFNNIPDELCIQEHLNIPEGDGDVQVQVQLCPLRQETKSHGTTRSHTVMLALYLNNAVFAR
jgi:hypothetical protein